MWPTKARAMSMIRWLRPPTFISSPARMKKGTASRGKLSKPACRFCASSWVLKKSRCHIRATPDTSRETAMGMPIAMEANRTARKISVVSMRALLGSIAAAVQDHLLEQQDFHGGGHEQGGARSDRQGVADDGAVAVQAGDHLVPGALDDHAQDDRADQGGQRAHRRPCARPHPIHQQVE